MIKSKKSNRIIEYDIARVLAVLCVVLCHSVESIYKIYGTYLKTFYTYSTSSKLFAISTFNIGRIGVPLFLFLSGALLLNKEIENDDDVLFFYKHNLLPLIICNTIWVCLYNIFFYFTDQKTYVTLDYILKELVFLKKVPMAHMWYIPAIIGLYLGIPFLAKIIKTFKYKTISILIYIIVLFYFLLPTVNTILQVYNVKFLVDLNLLEIHYFGRVYGIYVILGYLISKLDFSKIKTYLFYILAVFGFICCILLQYVSYLKDKPYSTWYDSFFLLVLCIGIFGLICSRKIIIKNNFIKNLIIFISKASLSIFFIHKIIIHFAVKHINNIPINNPGKVTLLFISASTISILLSYALSKNKIISKYIILFK